jgi:hypothetical protein
MKVPMEELLELAAKRGLTSFTLSRTESVDGKTTYWHASATPAPGKPWSARSRDIAIAVEEALTEMPAAPLKVKPRFDSVNPPLSELAQRAAENITAAVNEPEVKPDTLESWLPKP